MCTIKLKRQRPSTEIDGLLLVKNKCIILMVFIQLKGLHFSLHIVWGSFIKKKHSYECLF